MNKRLLNQTAIKTNNGRAIGTGIVKEFAKEGANITINYSSSKEVSYVTAHVLNQTYPYI